ncbi:MAG: patatin-like phospholipase family protein [Campylobacterota bacterium]|nr:patatin-like phospholipase family protein [Campylobacterota bacterium]
MRFLLLLSLVFTLSLGADRPKIGLVLSGGGARGGAHLGVIKMLEKHHIPIDVIVGTSMGSMVGGLYASGKTTQEIEILLTQTQWNQYIANDFARQDIPFRSKQFDFDFPGKLKVGINENSDIVLQTGIFNRQSMLALLDDQTFKVREISNFDNFPIPYRAVASNIENGEEVVLKSGSLSKAIYASIAVPGGFQPIEIDGKVLVDGGISSNLPLSVMREIGVDIIIAVDVSTPFDKNLNVDSYTTVLSQMSNILMRKNVEDTIASMKKNEILITPALDGVGTMDADRYPEIIKIGEEAVESVYTEKLAQLSVSEDAYKNYQKMYRLELQYSFPIIDRIEILNKSDVSDELIYGYLHVKEGERLDLQALHENLMLLYNLTLFETVDYELTTETGETVLTIITTPSWDANGIIRFGLGFEENFNGESDYSIRFEYMMQDLNSYGGQWRNRFEIGKEQLIFTELYQPLDVMRRSFIRSYLFYRENKVYITPSTLGDFDDTVDTMQLQAKEKGAGFAGGYNISNSIQFEAGIRAQENDVATNAIEIADKNISFVNIREQSESRFIYARLRHDSFDNAYFPTRGIFSDINWKKEMPNWSSELDYSLVGFRLKTASSNGDHTLLPAIQYTSTYEGKIGHTSLQTLGGFGKLSGYPSNAIAGNSLGLGVLEYRYRLQHNDFLGALSAPIYLGGMYEVGNAWLKGESVSWSDMIHAGNIYIASDTIFGPLYLAYGGADQQHTSFYFYLGNTF